MSNEAKLVITAEDRASAVFRDISGSVGRLEGVFDTVAGPIGRFGGLLGAITGSAAVAGFRALVGSIDDLDEAAQGLQIGATTLANFRQAAREAGVDADKFDGALTRLNVRIADAASGNEDAARLFKALGVAVKDAGGAIRPTDEVLRELAGRFATLQDSPAKAALAVELFGRSGAKLIPLLNGGADNLERFAGLTDQTVREAARLQSEFDRLGASTERFKNTLAGSVLPTINDTAEALSRIDFGKVFSRGLPGLIIREFAQQAEEAAAKQRQLREALALGAGAYSNEGRAAQQSAQAILDNARAKEKNKQATQPAEQITESQRALGQLVEQLERQRNTLEDISRTEQVLQFLRANPGVDTPQVRELLFDQARLNDELEQERDIRRELARISKEELAAVKALDDQLAEFSGRAEIARKQALTARLEARLAAGEQFSPEELDRAVKGIAGIAGETEKATDAAERFALAISSSLGSFIEGQGRGGVKGFFEAITQDVLKLTTQLLILKPIAEGLTELFGGAKAASSGGQSVAGFLGSLVSGFAGARAAGGPVSANRAYLVGERGPELFVPSGSGGIVPNNRMGGTSVRNNFYLSGPVSSQTQSQIAAETMRGVLRAQRRLN